MSARCPLAVLAVFACLAWTAPAEAHLRFSDGSWTFRYFTTDADGDLSQRVSCATGADGVDPTNIIVWQYGAGDRIDTHLANETHFGHTINPGLSLQVTCPASSPGVFGGYEPQFDEQDGHTDLQLLYRAHFRLFHSGHSHSEAVNSFTVLDAHHEHFQGGNHVIDEPWEQWEHHVASEMDPHHNVWYDYFDHGFTRTIQRFPDDGLSTRIGGEHDGNFP